MNTVHMTEAQARVAQLVAAGLSNPQVAQQLRIAESTVKNHLNAIYGQGVVVNRNELINYCRTGGAEHHEA